MTTTAISEKLHNYISIADDKKIKAIYTLLEEQMTPVTHWSEDKEFVADIDERIRWYDAGIDRGLSLEEVRTSLDAMKKEYHKNAEK